MAKVAAFELDGLDLWFNSNDHLPPHFHAEKPSEWQVVVRFLRDGDDMFDVVWPKNPKKKGGGPRKAELQRIAGATVAHRAALFEQWERVVAVKDPGPER